MKELIARTIVPIRPLSSPLLRHDDQLVLLGSCFSDEVGGRLRQAGHRALSNPLGTMFNPASLDSTLQWLAAGGEVANYEIEWCERQGHHFCFDAGTALAHEDAAACAAGLNAAVREGHASLISASALFVTLGSAWAYTRRSTGRIVANCHRQPHADFERRLLKVGEISDHLRSGIAAARGVNPDVRVVLTVSPVRHWREGAVESSRSKAHLLAAAHDVVDETAAASYFPSYEMMIDELRDYRWYGEDMLHPSSAAADYVAQRLLESHFAREDDDTRDAVAALRAAARHRHARPRSAAAASFAAEQRNRLLELSTAHPHVDLAAEAAHFESMLAEAGGGISESER